MNAQKNASFSRKGLWSRLLLVLLLGIMSAGMAGCYCRDRDRPHMDRRYGADPAYSSAIAAEPEPLDYTQKGRAY